MRLLTHHPCSKTSAICESCRCCCHCPIKSGGGEDETRLDSLPLSTYAAILCPITYFTAAPPRLSMAAPTAHGAEDPREGASSLMAITLSTELGSQSQSHSFLSSSFTAWSADGVKWAGKFDSSNNIAASHGRTPISGRKSPPRCPISPFSFPLSTAAREHGTVRVDANVRPSAAAKT